MQEKFVQFPTDHETKKIMFVYLVNRFESDPEWMIELARSRRAEIKFVSKLITILEIPYFRDSPFRDSLHVF